MSIERMTGYATFYEKGEEVELAVSFDLSRHMEPHPYGDTVALEPMAEVVEDSEEYCLDGVDMTYEELLKRVGSHRVDLLIGECIENAG